MIEGLKPFYNNALRPLVIPLVKIGIHPNHLSITGVALFLAAGALALRGLWIGSLVFVIIGALLDGLDGLVARESNQKSVFGAILDSSCDRLTEIFLLLGVLGYFLTTPLISFEKTTLSIHERGWGIVLCYCATAMSLMVSYVKARCEGAGVACASGLLQRPERIILLCAGLLFGPRAMVWVLGAITLFAVITVIQRIVLAYKKAKP